MTISEERLFGVPDVEQARRYFRQAIEGYGQLPIFLSTRIAAASEFYFLTPPATRRELDQRIKPDREPVSICGGFAVRTQDDVAQLGSFICSVLNDQPRNICIIEDVLARRGDKSLLNSTCEVKYVEDAVFYVITAAAGQADVEQCLRKARLTFGHSLCVVTQSELLGRDTSSKQMWHREFLSEAAQRSMWAAVSVFGGETFLLARLLPNRGDSLGKVVPK